MQGKGSSNDAAAAAESGGSSEGRQGQVGGSPVTGETAGAAAGQPAQVYRQENYSSVPEQGSGLQPQAGGYYNQPQAGGNYIQPQVEGNYMQPQAESRYTQPSGPSGGNYMQ